MIIITDIFPLSLRLQMVYPNTWISWFQRQMDLELVFSIIVSLCTTNWNKWAKLFTDLLALVLAYAVSILIAISFKFSQSPQWNIFTFLSLCISHVLMEKIFRFQLRHHTCLIKPTFLQLHHRTSLIKLPNITSLHHNYNTCSILTFHHSNITSHYLVFIHLQIHSDFQLPHLPSTFVSLTQRYVPYSISKLLLLPSDVKINPGLQPIDENSVFCSMCSNKINRGVQQGMVTHLLRRKLQCTMSSSL